MSFPALAADLVCPLLGAGVFAAPLLRRSAGRPWLAWGRTGAALGWVYALAFLDHRFGWWSAAAMDFSTHTGVALVLAAALARLEPRALAVLAALLLAYAALMIVLGYHSVPDLATSALATLPAMLFLRPKKWHPRQDSNLEPAG